MLQSRSRSAYPALVTLFWLVACGTPAVSNVPTAQPSPESTAPIPSAPTLTATPTASVVPATFTPLPTATRPAPTPLPEPTLAAQGAQLVHIPTTDGGTVLGELLGSGSTAVVFAVMGNCSAGWTALAEETASQGFLVLTYRWRACEGSHIDQRTIRQFVDDARAAVQFVQAQGATQIILVGASLGGCASAKLLAETKAAGLVVIASPATIPDWDFQITADDLNTNVPKLFISSEDDQTVPASATRTLYELAAKPRTWQTYPGSAHGTDIFTTEHGPALKKQILAFLNTIRNP